MSKKLSYGKAVSCEGVSLCTSLVFYVGYFETQQREHDALCNMAQAEIQNGVALLIKPCHQPASLMQTELRLRTFASTSTSTLVTRPDQCLGQTKRALKPSPSTGRMLLPPPGDAAADKVAGRQELVRQRLARQRRCVVPQRDQPVGNGGALVGVCPSAHTTKSSISVCTESRIIRVWTCMCIECGRRGVACGTPA